MNSIKRTIAVLGATGNFGHYVANQLAEDGHQVHALVRKPTDKLSHLVQSETGEATNPTRLKQFVEGKDVVVYGLSPAYHKWEESCLSWLEMTLDSLDPQTQTLVFPANVYVFNPENIEEANSHHAFQPVSRKGQIRAQMEQRLSEFCAKGGRVISVRAGDFIGRHAENTWFDFLVNVSKNKVTLQVPHQADTLHTWGYLPDIARLVSETLDQELASGELRSLDFTGQEFTIQELAAELEKRLNKRVVTKPTPWWLYKSIGLFVPLLGAVVEMRYLWQHRLALTPLPKERQLIEKHITPLSQVVEEVFG